MPAVYDHASPPGEADHPAGVYRVVGVTDGSVTLLRVADADGRRVATGETVTVDRDAFAAFEPAPNPDGNRPAAAALVAAVETGCWSVRAFARELLARPRPTAVGVAAVLFGVGGDRLVDLPAPVFAASIVAGSLALAAVGSGRL